MISDEAATVGDTVVIDAVADAIRIAGLATGTISYRADGTFADGITVWTGSGADTISIDATHRAPGVRTVTFLNTGLGNDIVTVDLTAGERRLARARHPGRLRHVLPLGGSDVDRPASVDGLTLAPRRVGRLQRLRRPARRAAAGLRHLRHLAHHTHPRVPPRGIAHDRHRPGSAAGDVVTATVNGIAVSVLSMDATRATP